MRFTVAFDVDDTLIKQDSRGEDVPNYPVINLLLQLHALGAKIIVWSGGGIEYSTRWVEKLGLTAAHTLVVEKGAYEVDLAVDDEEVALGTSNFRIRG